MFLLKHLKRYWFWTLLIICALHGTLVFYHYQKAYPSELLHKKVTVTGYIASLPESTYQATSFLFQTKEGLIRLSWYSRFSKVKKPNFEPGQQWQFGVKLKKPRGFNNPNGFDYGEYLKQQGIQASGYIDSKNIQYQGQNIWRAPVDWVRFKVKTLIHQTAESSQILGVVDALLLGDKSGLTFKDKQLFQKTGTSHLIAISGLHIGLIALWVFILIRFLWGRFNFLARRAPAQKVAVMGSLFAALCYALLAGFTLPTQRALIMIMVAGFIILAMKKMTTKRVWLIAFTLVVFWNPFSLISAGFWLSFLAVAFLLLALSGRLGCFDSSNGILVRLFLTGVIIRQYYCHSIGEFLNCTAYIYWNYFIIDWY